MLHLIDSPCAPNRDCPNVNADTDARQWVVVGYTTDRAAVVELPAELATDWADTFPRRGGNLLVEGSAVTDRAVLAELNMDPGESAVRLSFDAVPMLAKARHLVGAR